MLDQAEADRLMRMEKIPLESREYVFPGPREEVEIQLGSRNGQDRFLFNIHRKYVKEFNCTYQERHGMKVVLIRLDMCSRSHRNPPSRSPPMGFEAYGGVLLTVPHLHIYVEGYSDKWAMPASDKGFVQPQSVEGLTENLTKFLDFCNIRGNLRISGVLV